MSYAFSLKRDEHRTRAQGCIWREGIELLLGSRHGGGLYYVDGLAMYVGYETYTSGVHIAAVNISCMLQTPELTAAIENSYRTFAVYPLRTDTGPCSCCHSPQDNHRLCAKPLRMLGPKDLRTYAYDALYTWGDEVDFKHFLPRIMELLAQANGDGPAFVDPESVFHKLSYQIELQFGLENVAARGTKSNRRLHTSVVGSAPRFGTYGAFGLSLLVALRVRSGGR